MLVLEPIFEADLPPEQYAYRPGRNAQQAVVEVQGLLFRGHPEVVDADLADYFGSIPHAELLQSVARRIVDRRVLHLIKMWLVCPVEETDVLVEIQTGADTLDTAVEPRLPHGGRGSGSGNLGQSAHSEAFLRHAPAGKRN